MRIDNVIITGRASYLKIVESTTVNGGKPRRTGNIILDPADPKQKADLDKIRAHVTKAETEEFNGMKLEGNACCLRNGNTQIDDETGEVRPEYAGKWYVSFARADDKGPALVVTGSQNVDITPDHPDYPYSGSWCAVKLNLYTINGKTDKKSEKTKTYGKKLCAGLEVIKLVKHDTRFGGGGKASADDMPESQDEGL